MFETSDPEIKVEQLMRDIRETVARQRRVADEPGADEPRAASSSPDSALSTTNDLSPLPEIDPYPASAQPEFQPRDDGRYHVNDLLQYHGAEFVRNAYRAVLKREPDEAGLAQHLNHLASGRFNKVDVLASLRSSPEGERAGVKIDGLALPAAIRRLGRVPLIGYLVQTVVAAARLPQLLQHQRQSEFYLLAQQQQILDRQQRIVEHYDEVHRRVAQSMAQSLAQLSARDDATAEQAARQHEELIELVRRHREEADERRAAFSYEVETHLTNTRRLFNQSAAALTHQSEEQARKLLEQLGQTREELSVQGRVVSLLREELSAQERLVALLLEEVRAHLDGGTEEPHLRAMAGEAEHLLDPLYAAFEDQFRGAREEIKERLRVYLPVLRAASVAGDVLDIGCGRGEWLELLKENGVACRGVDHNRVFVERCRARGLDVIEADAVSYLGGLPDESLNAATSFHLVEHLPFETLIKLIDEIMRTLRRGAPVILETPDPENIVVGSYGFYADPTHRNPIPSPTLKFLLEARGFSRVEVMKLRPPDEVKLEGDAEIVKRFNQHFYSARDYAVVGWKD
ncbi:MAG: methyltransferase domain-containing protein [Pyrinomonadaceae bacterium]